jgi:hypothetical protein
VTSSEQRTRLRELAEQATPGPRVVTRDGGVDANGEGWFHVEVDFPDGDPGAGLMLGDHELAEADAAFIAAANPAAVLALLDALTQAEEELGRARDVLGLLAASQWNVARS